jgi:hypothetical protein
VLRQTTAIVFLALSIPSLVTRASAQGIQPYPNAVTDRAIHPETPMALPATNVVFTDPDFGEQMVRATDGTTNFKSPNTFLRTEGSGQANEWSEDTSKFYVLGTGGRVFAFAFNPATMTISSLPGAGAGQALLLPLNPGPSFSLTDPDLMYGTTAADPLTITSYRFSTGELTSVIDTTTCGVQPALGSGSQVVSDDDVTPSLNDQRLSISEGGPQFGEDMFVIVYDKTLGCRWYNTQTGAIGGQWGPSGSAPAGMSYLVRHAYLSRSGNYVRILTDGSTWYIWDVATLTISSCVEDVDTNCGGYGVTGYNTYVNGPNQLDDMQMVKRSMNNLNLVTSLFYPLPVPGYFDQEHHLTWSNVDVNDSVPACGSTYDYEGDTDIDEPFAGEIFCIETDGLASTVWRFAHNRAVWQSPYFQTQPLGSVSSNGKFLLFTSTWDATLGLGTDGTPRSDVIIVKLD